MRFEEKGYSLTKKLTEIVDHLLAERIFKRQDAAPIRSACQNKSFLSSSIVSMNEYVHNFQNEPIDAKSACGLGGIRRLFGRYLKRGKRWPNRLKSSTVSCDALFTLPCAIQVGSGDSPPSLNALSSTIS